MDLIETIKERHSVRQFTDKPVTKAAITDIVKLASHAPSWVNSQPWRVYCAMGDSLAKIKTLYQKQSAAGNHGNPDLPVISRDAWDSRSQANMKQWRHEIVHHFKDFDEAHAEMTNASDTLYGSPAILYVTIPQASPEWSIFDAGLFAQTVMLLAADKGLATIPTYNSVRFPDILHQVLKVPASERLIIGISLGYPANTTINSYRSKRQPLDQVLHFR